ncbi:hypothetical protein E2562_039502 [Oryza meyeriana var. granulata]|uniref:Uncharacterized protein n=1 Tax=Oryza meyeriana var. granulata TaxID=110450 RepID=A0A6G1DW33_9ORYZ|nr:hypothetical protein E2562_039502 [Oryza meyeriana var. granulata]
MSAKSYSGFRCSVVMCSGQVLVVARPGACLTTLSNGRPVTLLGGCLATLIDGRGFHPAHSGEEWKVDRIPPY